jgi:hypothetical protein
MSESRFCLATDCNEGPIADRGFCAPHWVQIPSSIRSEMLSQVQREPDRRDEIILKFGQRVVSDPSRLCETCGSAVLGLVGRSCRDCRILLCPKGHCRCEPSAEPERAGGTGSRAASLTPPGSRMPYINHCWVRGCHLSIDSRSDAWCDDCRGFLCRNGHCFCAV